MKDARLVALEAVPRSREALEEAVKTAALFPGIRIINVPDLGRFDIRSWEACGILAATGSPAAGSPATGSAGGAETGGAEGGPFSFMPHLRARDFDPARPFPHADYLRDLGIDRVLVIAGDADGGEAPAGIASSVTIPFIKKLKNEMPHLLVYAAFDPYRSNIRYELDYLKAKEDAGAAGFFSQPFFDLRLLEIYAEYLEGKDIYWGVSPVLSERNRHYWESRNRAVFPKSFRPDLCWNVDFGRQVLDFCEKRRFNLYLIPIKADLEKYLSGLLGNAR